MQTSTVDWSVFRTTGDTARSLFYRTQEKYTLPFHSCSLSKTATEIWARHLCLRRWSRKTFHTNVQLKNSTCTLQWIFSSRFPLLHAEVSACPSLNADWIVWKGDDGYNTISPESSNACFIHQPACTAESPSSTVRDPQVTPFHSFWSLTGIYMSTKVYADWQGCK